MDYMLFQDSDGMIVRTGTTDSPLSSKESAGISVLAGDADPVLHYVVNPTTSPVKTDRPVNLSTIDVTDISADDVDAATISGIPNPSTVYIKGPVNTAPTVITDGEVVFTTDTEGVYTIEIHSFPELDDIFTVTAT